MKYIIFILLLGCTTIVEKRDWQWCEYKCKGIGLEKLGKKTLGGICCECSNGKIYTQKQKRPSGRY